MNHLFVNKLNEIIQEHLSDENFGPKQLSSKVGMSHSTLHRKLKEDYNKTISQFIREVRLEKARELLQDEDLSVSEIAYRVGFGSPTYFSKCFHEYFGETPGEYKKKEKITLNTVTGSKRAFSHGFFIVGLVLILVVGILHFNGKLFALKEEAQIEKSIAVRPFNYLVGNSEKEYLANAMMMEIVYQLSQIQGLRVMSLTSVLPYKDQPDKIIGKKLDCSFILDGDLLIEEDKIKLILTLVNTSDESVEKSYNYKKKLDDIIELPGIIAQSVAKDLHVELSEGEKSRISKTPTVNLTAYDFFQRGREEHLKYWANNNNLKSLTMAERYYKKALECDSTFARAYTGLAIVCWRKNYWADYFKHSFLDSVKIFVDKAFSFDPELPEAYIMNGEYLRANGFFKEAEKEYDKALALNPNDWMAYVGKANLYVSFDLLEGIKNLHHALSLNRGSLLPVILVRLYYVYLDAGFIQQALHFAEEKVKFDEDSAKYLFLKANSEYHNKNYKMARDYSLKAYEMDTNNMDLLNHIGWYYDCLGQYEKSLKYYQRIIDVLENQNEFFTIQFDKLHRMGYSFYRNGDSAMADYYFDLQVKVCTTAIEAKRVYSDYFHYDLAGVQAFRGEKDKAYENLEILLQKEGFPLWFAILVQIDPLFDSLRGEKRFKEFINEVQIKYSNEHQRVKNWLEEQELI